MTILRWLRPWLVPLALVVGLVVAVVSVWLAAVMVLAVLLDLVYLRLRSLKKDPPNPELRRRNFWDFR